MFILLLFLSFIAGILTCIPVANVISPPPAYLLIILFVPWMILFLFSQFPIINNIRYIYLSFLIGMCCYWTYFETVKKLKG
jgi:hypothetical protein